MGMIRFRSAALFGCVALTMLACGCSRYEDQRPSDPNQGWHYKLRRGDTIAKIAEMSGRTKKEIAYTNGFGNPAYIEPGRYILIPPRGRASMVAARSNVPRLHANRNYKTVPRSGAVAPYATPRPMKNSNNGHGNNGYKKPKRASDADKKGFQWPIDLAKARIDRLF